MPSPPATIAAIEVVRLREYVRARAPAVVAGLPALSLAGTSERELWDERVPASLLFEQWAAIARAIRDPALPVDFGSRTRLEHLGLFGLALRTARTVSEALEYTRRFQRLFTNSGAIHIEASDDELWWQWLRPGPRTLGLRLANETALVEQVALVRQLIPGATPRAVCFRHPAPADVRAHRRFFACPIEWSAEEEGLRWERARFERALPPIDEALSRYVSDEATRRLAALGSDTVAARAHDAIARRLVSAELSLEIVAAALALTPRQLRSGLSDEGTTLRRLVDEVRRDTARVLVETGRHSMTEIAFLIGLSEASAFSRAWRRWFGAAPRLSRRSARASAGSSRRPR